MEENEIITPQQFDEQLNELTKRTVQVLGSKAGEYATDENRYHNFVVSKALANIASHPVLPLTIPQVIWFFCIKHVTSCMDIIKDVTRGKKFKVEYIDEKFGDFVNYLFLLWIYIRTKHSIEEDAN